MQKLFSDFKGSSETEWIEKIKKDLKGKQLEVLNQSPEKGIELPAYFFSREQNDHTASRNLNQHKEWKVRVEDDAEGKNNKKLLSILNNGTDALALNFCGKDKFDETTKDILFEYIETEVFISSPEQADSLRSQENIEVNYDPIAINAQKGNWDLDINGLLGIVKSANGHVFVNGFIYGQTGADSSTELACTIAHLNEYLNILTKNGMSPEEINPKIRIMLSVNENYFLNVAKFRAIRELVALLFKGYDNNYETTPVTIVAKTNIRHLTKNDRYNNFLRQTTQAMSAVIGGCDRLTVTPDSAEDEPTARLVRNIQLILKEEAYLGKVSDIAGGAYIVEELTDQLIQNAWKYFLDIEDQNGLIASLKANNIQKNIEVNRSEMIDQLNSGKKTLVGVNKYRNSMEDWIDLEAKELKQTEDASFIPLTPFKLEASFEKKLQTNE